MHGAMSQPEPDPSRVQAWEKAWEDAAAVASPSMCRHLSTIGPCTVGEWHGVGAALQNA
eukprot:m.867175 g.867175  ORF g.867175 m.867175 type:complete len:59 (-) comp23554_c3_seq9:205-381(-)